MNLLGNEEFEFAHRPFLKDKRIAYEPSVVVPHRIGANRLCKAFFLRRHFDHACIQARHMPARIETRILGGQRRPYRLLLGTGRTALVYTSPRRPDAFLLQLSLAAEARTIWGAMTRRGRMDRDVVSR